MKRNTYVFRLAFSFSILKPDSINNQNKESQSEDLLFSPKEESRSEKKHLRVSPCIDLQEVGRSTFYEI